ncbi:hypothetical protein [Hyalangium sp.]|uniref:hypothetical protein n=1 Tax=Hyalangium sp. TaxID=2028555 RepID=UPI002D52BAC9|nr:hypothetical protein [Hyalangium sp.]HYH97462.1 hypothetical protein [Hyalangium sp.]
MRVHASLALLLTVTGCTTTHKLPKAELARLDGWVGQETTLLQDIGSTLRNERKDIRRLRDLKGNEHPFTVDTSLVLFPHQGDEIVGEYVAVHVDGQRFRGVPRAALSRDIEVPLDGIESAGVRKFSLGKTVLLGSGVIVGLAVSLIAVGLAVGDGGGGGGDDDD